MRPPVSVCMATYNGAAHFREQLDSILGQLLPHDELVIVDDCSSDTTLELLSTMSDARMKVHVNEVNLGVVRSFEKALGLASSELIFLSDQDDIWMPQKVERCVASLSSGMTLVISDAYILADDVVTLDTFYGFRRSGPGLLRNYFKNSFIGCCLAFRRDLLNIALPFPTGIPMHDAWLGIMASAVGQVEFLPERLILYRRHANNVTSMKRSRLGVIAASRFQFLRAILTRLLGR